MGIKYADNKRYRILRTCCLGGCVVPFSLFVVLIICSRTYFAYKRSRDAREWRENNPPVQVVFHSTKPFHEVKIPFTQSYDKITKSSYLIHVKGNFAGKTTDCVVDSGCTYTGWPPVVSFTGKHTGFLSRGKGIGGTGRQQEEVILPDSCVGNFEVKNLHAGLFQQVRSGPQGIADAIPVIGNNMFVNSVLTIDYKRRQLIIRDGGYAVSHQSRHRRDILLDMEWMKGCPVISGRLEGHPARFLVDTGCKSFMLTRTFAERFLRSRQVKTTLAFGAFGNVVAPVYLPVHGEIGSVSFSSSAPCASDVALDVDAVIGYEYFRSTGIQRITLDYPHRKILLERNASDTRL